MNLHQVKSNSNPSIETAESPLQNQATETSPNRVITRDADALPMVELSPINQNPAEQSTHYQRDDTVAMVADIHLVRSETEDFFGDYRHSMEQQTLPNTCISRSDGRARREPDSSRITGARLTWKAHHQDFYASKWFRSLQIFFIVSVIAVAGVVFWMSSSLGVDIFGPRAAFFFIPLIFLSPVFLYLCVVVGGVFKSRVFR